MIKNFLGSPFKLFASIFHWAMWHFDLSKYSKAQHPRIFVSWLACATFLCTALPFLYLNCGGAWGVVKYWLMPWLGYHFWMSTFTIIHHTAPHIPFKPHGEWNAAKAQLSGTVHCDFPKCAALCLCFCCLLFVFFVCIRSSIVPLPAVVFIVTKARGSASTAAVCVSVRICAPSMLLSVFCVCIAMLRGICEGQILSIYHCASITMMRTSGVEPFYTSRPLIAMSLHC